MKYIQRFDGEGFKVPVGKVTRFACCECHLVHDLVLMTHEGEPGEIGVAVRVNRRATAQRRRAMTGKAKRTDSN